MANTEDNNSNVSEDSAEKDKAIEQSKQEVKADAQGLWRSTKRFLKELLDFRNDTDRDATIEAIKGDISFKGATAWILICSIFVASVGLNANSTAVVIGAMLISPLMGPILGVGLSVAVNDIDTLKRSLINLAIMIVLSLLTAFLFFWIFPLSQDTSELLSRTQPDIRDVLISFFGGLALIIARTKKGTIATVIFGVAIATALMPPLCTVGYGLAVAVSEDPKKGIDMAIGAMYLFAINTIFIALATFLVLKLLRFPMLRYANSAKRKRIARFASLVALVVMIPATCTFVNVLNESTFKNLAQRFVENELDEFNIPFLSFVKKNCEYHYAKNENDSSYIEINIMNSGIDNADLKRDLYKVLATNDNYKAIKNIKLSIPEFSDKKFDELKYLQELKDNNSKEIKSQKETIETLKAQLLKLSYLEKDQIPIDDIENKLMAFQEIDSFSFVIETRSNFKKADTLKIFNIKWNDSLSPAERLKERVKLESILKEVYQQKNMEVRNMN
ncbi:MAG: DUF389 domain-containing protein [Bacteroidia bacterium]|nr:DUF389 domain-containing protein [Bacteroidia bacterium]NNK59660.1 DUF389 domain-containing protein [Flavobacteriaceae bacterium]NNL32973.1 DUF389 domain-containing protein [Flavobacteriaceae bacterium]